MNTGNRQLFINIYFILSIFRLYPKQEGIKSMYLKKPQFSTIIYDRHSRMAQNDVQQILC